MEAATSATAPVPGTASNRTRSQKAWWVEPLEPYAGADLRRSMRCVATSALPYVLLWPAMVAALSVSYWLTFAIAVLAAGFLLRTYIVFHDCSHGSFMPTKRGNTWVGTAVGLLVFSPFESWKLEHAAHHASSGDLDRRGVGDVETWTVAEYHGRSWLARLGYRLFRNPWVMLILGPIWSLALEPRLIPLAGRRRVKMSRFYTDLGLAALITGMILLIGWKAYLEIQGPIVLMAGSAGVWLFYVQHQFEGVYWRRSGDWSYVDAALQGSSYLKLPKVLQFFTGNIGLHHVHHLNSRIPNYNLQRAHDDNPIFHRVPTLTLWQALATVNLKLWDEQRGRLVTFAQARCAQPNAG